MGKSFHKKNGLNQHKCFYCQSCHQNFRSQAKLDLHKCQQSEKHKCTKCNKSFIKDSSLREHIKVCQGNLKCNLCHKTFTNFLSFDSHNCKYKCNKCEQIFESVIEKSAHSCVKCRKCGSSDVAWEQKQTRGADEAMTVFCTCSKCNLRWKM